jgi:hypothetical protein
VIYSQNSRRYVIILSEGYVGDQEIKGCRCKDWRHEMTRKLGVGNITCNDKI